jgi:hypothetical protein
MCFCNYLTKFQQPATLGFHNHIVTGLDAVINPVKVHKYNM